MAWRLLIAMLVLMMVATGCQRAPVSPESWRGKLAAAPRRSVASLAPDENAWRVPLEVAPLERGVGGLWRADATVQSEHRWGNMLHRVRRGDTLYHLARSYYGNAKYWRAIYAENRGVLKTGENLHVGQVLHLPAAPLKLDTTKARRRPGRRCDYYVVDVGDSLVGIARWLLGDEKLWPRIAALNRDVLSDPNRLLPGTVLEIPQ